MELPEFSANEIKTAADVWFIKFLSEPRAQNVLKLLRQALEEEQIKALYKAIFSDGTVWTAHEIQKKLENL